MLAWADAIYAIRFLGQAFRAEVRADLVYATFRQKASYPASFSRTKEVRWELQISSSRQPW